MKKFKLKLMLMLALPVLSFASNSQMKETLVQIIDACEAIKILINKADKEQDKNPRYKVHFNSFKDANGATHNGLRDDINEIQKSLIGIVNDEARTPRKVENLEHDFVDKDFVDKELVDKEIVGKDFIAKGLVDKELVGKDSVDKDYEL